jgi:transcriptional regulator with XRE-family HTH domain
VESGRHEPSVSAALAIAGALGVSVEALFAPPRGTARAEPVVAARLSEGPVRVGSVRGRLVAGPVTALDALDGVVPDGRWTAAGLELDEEARPARVVLAGCEPVLGVLAASAGDGTPAWWVRTSSGAAREALAAGRAHLAAVHEREDHLPAAPDGVAVFDLARWRVGLAHDPCHPSARDAVRTGGPVAQRERAAGTQAAFTRWLRRSGMTRPAGRRVSGHVEACRLVAAGGACAAVTTEPAALAAGLGFEPIEEHVVRLWCPRDLLDDPAVAMVLDLLASAAFARRVAALPAYDVTGLGRTVA